jgi:hypothetical protein
MNSISPRIHHNAILSGETMTKKKHSCPFQKGTFIEKTILLSPAFIALSKHGRMILFLFLLKRQMPGNFKSRKMLPKDTVINNGELELSYKELYSIGLKNQQIARGFDDVIEKGFIKMTERGGKGKGSYNLYQLLNDWKDYGTDKFKEREREKSVGYGYCKSKIKLANNM